MLNCRLVYLLCFAAYLSLPPISQAVTEEQPWLSLVRPNAFDGWDHGTQSHEGWTQRDGSLSGRHGAPPLVSGWSAEDFELRWNWNVEDQGQWKLLLYPVPSGEPVECRLSDDELCGRLTVNDKVYFAGAKVAAVPKKHHSVLTRRSGKIALTVDDVKLFEIEFPRDRRFALGLAIHEGRGEISSLAFREPAGEPIFNGTDLTGWWTPGDIKSWAVEDGQIVCLNKNGNYLRTEKLFGNFTLSFDYKTAKGVNSGIGIRTPQAGWPSGDGMELQIYDHPGIDKHSTMALYGNCEPLDRADLGRQWNHCVIKADGRMISAWVNGQLVQHANTASLPELRHRHLQGWIGIQDHGGRIWLKNMRVHEAKPGLGLDAWYAKRPEPAPLVVLDRLMNTERLANVDGITSQVTSKSIEAEGPQALLDVTGPGALVRIAHSGRHDKLRLFFDGDAEPRLVADTADLRKTLPAVCEDSEPLLTCVPFAKRLRVEVERGEPARYELSTVSFAGASTDDVTLTSFTELKSSMPRGLLSALDYKHHQLSFGTHRENDPYDRVSTSPKTILPGQSGLLMSLDSAGTVLWMKLHGDPSLLESNDLWLEVRADGESEPLVNAPARFLFPALRVGQNHSSFLFTNRGGMSCMLAMPFSLGLQVTAVNHGQSPISGVHMTCSVDRSRQAAEQANRRMRLVGKFVSAGEDGAIVRQTGSGRWIGLVYETPDAASGVAMKLEIDDMPAADWNERTLDDFLGRRANQEHYTALAGQSSKLAWRYLLLEAPTFEQSIELTTNKSTLGPRLALFYLKSND